VVVERQPSDYGCNETFYDWSKDPAEVAFFENKRPINFGLASYKDGRIVQFAQSAEGGCTLETFHWEGTQLSRIEILYAERTENGLQKLADYQVARAEYDAGKNLRKLIIDWLPGLPSPPHVSKLETEVVFQRGSKNAEIDLRKASAAIQGMLKAAVEKYAAKHSAKRSARKHTPVTLIELIFSLGDGQVAPWFHLCFDNKPNGYAGGSYSHPDFAKLQFRDWLPAVQAACNGGKAAVIAMDGVKRTRQWDGLLRDVGDFLVSSLLLARKEGVFAALPRAKVCHLGVEDPTTGSFGWPAFADRGKRDLV
jgi:hypothetical protein